MAVSLLPMSALSYPPQNHMTGAHGQSACSGLPDSPAGGPSPSSNRRPKLSLQTTSLTNTYGSLTRGLGPNPAQATYTPTTANTLTNTWDLSIRPSPVSRTESPRPLPTRSQASQQPYAVALPFGLKSILKNSPLPPRQGSVSASPRDGRRKVFFPQPKHVAFKKNLEEVIVNTEYTATHYDLSSPESDVSDSEATGETSPDHSTNSNDVTTGYSSPPPSRKRKNRRDSGVYVGPLEQEEQVAPPPESTPSNAPTPRSCKRRKWHWTLEKSEGSESEASERSAPSTPIEGQEARESIGECPTKEDESDEAQNHDLPNSDPTQPSHKEGASKSQPELESCSDSPKSDGVNSTKPDETLNTNTNR